MLDEIDAALDTINIRNVVQYICSKKEEMQFIIVSLNQQLYSHADALIGICSDVSYDDCLKLFILHILHIKLFIFLDYWRMSRKFSIYAFTERIFHIMREIIFLFYA